MELGGVRKQQPQGQDSPYSPKGLSKVNAGAGEEEGVLRQRSGLQLVKLCWQTFLGSKHPPSVPLYNRDLVLPPRFPGLGEAATEGGQLY